ncbi:hypothetical protein [Candidatus Palauibacter sp.]|uniref:hypothetical protein n=1 Tax=Candidatus Palauibacter sp. TaxID=3101350 RepID=UPI003B5234A0
MDHGGRGGVSMRMMRTARATPALALVGFLPVACAGGDGGDGPRSVVRDSAGVMIVENGRPPLDSRLGWQIGAAPAVTIGTPEGDPAYELFGVGDATRLSDGRIAVPNTGSGELRIFDSNGVHLESWGGRGDGPGEFGFMAPTELVLWPGDSLMAREPFQRRISIFSVRGTFGRTLRLQSQSGYASVVGPLADGRVLAQTLTTYSGGTPGTSELTRPDLEYGILEADGSVHRDLGVFPGSELYVVNTAERTRARAYPFARQAFAFVWRDLVVVSTNDRYEIRAYRPDGSLARIVRRAHEARAPTRADLRDYVARQNPDQPDAVDAVADMPLVEAFPAFNRVVVDRLDHLWVEEFHLPGETPRLWTVFDPEGRVLGLVEVPGSFAVTEIGEDYILGTRRDALDIEYVESWSLDRSGS